MIMCQVDARTIVMGQHEIQQELKIITDVLQAIGSELVDADVNSSDGTLVAYVRAQSELVINDVFEASFFKVDSITYLGPIHEPYNDFRPTQTQPAKRAIAAKPVGVHARVIFSSYQQQYGLTAL
jgi:hypothetical protein